VLRSPYTYHDDSCPHEYDSCPHEYDTSSSLQTWRSSQHLNFELSHHGSALKDCHLATTTWSPMGPHVESWQLDR
jgi:hypothetical protein